MSIGDIFDGYMTFFNPGTIDNIAGSIVHIYGLIVGVGNVSANGSFINISFTAKSKSGVSQLHLYNVGVCDGGWFSAALVDELKTPFFGADGCYVGGWWSNHIDNNKIDHSIDSLWYGSRIFTSKYVQVMVLGLLSQNGFSYPVSFVENAIPNLAEGKTLAESIIGDICIGDNIIIGDPTFHFTC